MDPDFHILALSPLRWEPEYATHTCHVSILMNKMKILTLHLYLFQRTLWEERYERIWNRETTFEHPILFWGT